MAIKFGEVTRKSKFGRFKFGETANTDHATIASSPNWLNKSATSQAFKHDDATSTNWKEQ